MRSLSLFVGTCLLVLAGCGTGVRHSFSPYQPVGTALPIEVAVKHKADEYVNGTVHHRTSASAAYQATAMELRGGQLWALLPTEDLQAHDTVEYYIDVNRGGDFLALGSPGSPYRVRFLGQDGMVIAGLRSKAYATDDAHPVRIVLIARYQQIDRPTVVYQVPGVPGEVRAAMQEDGNGNFHIVVPRHGVSAGQWKYAVEISLNGNDYRIPRRGYRSFAVKHYHPPKVAEGRQDHH